MKASDIYFTAASAAQAALPPASAALIRHYDEIARTFARNGYGMSIPGDLAAADAAVQADPAANAAMQIRILGNRAVMAEYNAATAKAA